MEKFIEHPLIKSKKIESRLYQQILAAEVLKKGNSIIVAPTALGKTIVGVLVAAERLFKYKGSKVLILAPSKPLVIQHEESFRNFLKVSSTSITGSIKPEDRRKRWEEAQVVCATPQTIESDLLNKRYSLKQVSLMIIDECHRGVGSYAYVYLAQKYLQEAINPLILGLTASPGSDKEKIKTVCENLFINEVMIKSEEDLDVVPYFNPVEIEWVKVELGKEMKNIKKHLNKSLKHRLKLLKSMKVIPTISVSKKDLLIARNKVQNHISQTSKPPQECFKTISLIAASLNIHHALELLETQGISTLNEYFARLRKKNTKAAKGLLLDADFGLAMKLTRKSLKKGLEHPKLDKLIHILHRELKKGKNRIIVFTQYRDTLEMIYRSCVNENINAVKFFGQGSRNGKKGLTQKEQKNIIKGFRKGIYDVLLSTSVAEEGIDIPAVDLVLMYEPVPSEIRMIQRRGRTGRKESGRMMVLITKETRDEAYYWSSVHKERKMQQELGKTSVLENLDLTGKNRILMNDDSNLNSFKENLKGKKDRPLIYADSREISSKVVRELDKLNVEVIIKPLAVADYQVSADVVLERKTASDFVSSIIDQRLNKQAKEMVEEFDKPILILEGDNLYSGFISPNAIRGALASIAVDFQIPIIPTKSPEDTAALIRRIAIREQRHERPEIQIRTDKKPLTLWQQQLYVVESLPGVGPVNARKLMEEFGSVKEIFTASEDDLQKVEGIGKQIARNIKRVVETKFKKINKDLEQSLI